MESLHPVIWSIKLNYFHLHRFRAGQIVAVLGTLLEFTFRQFEPFVHSANVIIVPGWMRIYRLSVYFCSYAGHELRRIHETDTLLLRQNSVCAHSKNWQIPVVFSFFSVYYSDPQNLAHTNTLRHAILLFVRVYLDKNSYQPALLDVLAFLNTVPFWKQKLKGKKQFTQKVHLFIRTVNSFLSNRQPGAKKAN